MGTKLGSGSSIHLCELTATKMVAHIGSGATTAQSVARVHIEQILDRNPDVQAWQAFDPDYVLAQARRIDEGKISGHLSGVPFGIKAIIDTAICRSEYGFPIYRGYHPRRDAACIGLSRKRGGS